MTYFDLTMTPNPPMAAQTQWRMLAAVAAIMALAALRFVAVGAWLVLPFMALDVALLWWALRASTRAGRAVEAVRLDDMALTVRRVTSAGVERTLRLEPGTTRLEAAGEGARLQLWLTSPAARVRLGAFLPADERAAVRQAIEAGLWKWQRARR